MASSVQALATACASGDCAAVPSEFIRMEDEQPGTTTYRGGAPPAVPVVDLAALDHDRAAEAIAAAAREWGMFQLVNHSIPADAVAELQRVGTEFFELPPEEKEVRRADPATGSIEGYGTQLAKDLNDKKAWGDYLFHIVWPPSRVNHDYWPRKPSSYREVNKRYIKHLMGVVDKIMESLSLGLGLERDAVKEALGGEEMPLMLKINYYPPCPQPDLVLGLTAHTDIAALAVLAPNDVPGLQVFRDDVGWFNVEHIPGALIVHIGDQIEILSNGKYKSMLHRATVNKERTRITWPVFCEPPMEQVVGPLPELVTEENPAKYKTKKYKDYLYCKLNKLPQ